MADERWNESRDPWGRERRLDRDRAARDDFGPRDYGDDAAFSGRRFDEAADAPRGRPTREPRPTYAADRQPFRGEGAYYGANRGEDDRSAWRAFDSDQQRLHRGDYNPDRYTPNPREGRGEEGRSWWDRTQDQVSTWMGDDEARRRREWDQRQTGAHGEHRGRGPTGYRRSDQRIHDDINDRLTDDPHLDASHIEVVVKDGEATLSGHVHRREDKRRAEDLADAVSGVTHVQNNLRVLQHDQTQTPGQIPTMAGPSPTTPPGTRPTMAGPAPITPAGAHPTMAGPSPTTPNGQTAS
jgi:hypothetical protein